MNNKKKVYYAHFMGIYDTPQEKRDIETLESLGFEVVNPNNAKTSKEFKEALNKTPTSYELAFNRVFGNMVRSCDVFAFRSLPEGSISSGVYLELQYAETTNKLIIELPSNTERRRMSIDATRQALREFGKR